MRAIRRGVAVVLTLAGLGFLAASLTTDCVASGTCELTRGIQLFLGWVLTLIGGLAAVGEYVGRRR